MSVDAALRETYEELGEATGNIQVLGKFTTIPAITGVRNRLVLPRIALPCIVLPSVYRATTITASPILVSSQTLVSPVLGLIERDVGSLEHFTPQNEVAKIFTRSIEELRQWFVLGVMTFLILNNSTTSVMVRLFIY